MIKCKNLNQQETELDSNILCVWMNCMFEMFSSWNSIPQSWHLKFKVNLGFVTISNAICWHNRKEADDLQVILSQFTNLPVVFWGLPPMIKYSPSKKIADSSLLTSFKSPIFCHLLFWNWAMIDVLSLEVKAPPNIYAAESVDAVP